MKVWVSVVLILSGTHGWLAGQEARDVQAGGLSLIEQCEAMEGRVHGQWDALEHLLASWVGRAEPDLPAAWKDLFSGLENLRREVGAKDSVTGQDLRQEGQRVRQRISELKARLPPMSSELRQNTLEKVRRIETRVESLGGELETLAEVCDRSRQTLEGMKTEFDLNVQIEGVGLARDTLRRRAALLAGTISEGRSKVSAGGPFENSLGMKFIPLPMPGKKILMSIWETRVQDFKAFRPETGGEADHPVTKISWDDAVAFCEWLSHKEGRNYRLPTDHEWSVAVGIGDQESPAASPRDKDGIVTGLYPWGTGWPPLPGAGNYGRSLNIDPYEKTARVGSFLPNGLGIYDLGGNVWEWCEDRYSKDSTGRVLRGASCNYVNPGNLLSSFRYGLEPGGRVDDYGFRCVLDGTEER